jgi:hypothetical protein
MKDTIVNIVLVLVFLDIFSAILWSFSGQVPQTGFYLGMITRNILTTIL